MDERQIRQLLADHKSGRLDEAQVLAKLRRLPFEAMGFAHIDHHRTLRRGFPEVVFCEGKPLDQALEIVGRILNMSGRLLATRAGAELAARALDRFPTLVYHRDARILASPIDAGQLTPKGLLIMSAGTADFAVAEEARLTAAFAGIEAVTILDIGVAGIHRLIAYEKELEQAKVIVVVAGMEGALPSVVAGVVPCPVIAVPTSVGYGASFGGLSALLTMLNSCAAGITVVNIDNGFGAAYAACQILRLGDDPGKQEHAPVRGASRS